MFLLLIAFLSAENRKIYHRSASNNAINKNCAVRLLRIAQNWICRPFYLDLKSLSSSMQGAKYRLFTNRSLSSSIDQPFIGRRKLRLLFKTVRTEAKSFFRLRKKKKKIIWENRNHMIVQSFFENTCTFCTPLRLLSMNSSTWSFIWNCCFHRPERRHGAVVRAKRINIKIIDNIYLAIVQIV